MKKVVPMDYSELLKNRRSIRDFTEEQVPTELVMELIQESCLAPSAGHGQPWEFIVVQDNELIRKISDESKHNFLDEVEANPDSLFKQYEQVLRNDKFNVFYNAPCLVLIVGSRKVRSLAVDCSLAAAYLMFAATSRGLGSCWVDLGGNIKSKQLLQDLGLPEGHAVVAPVIVGYPKQIPEIRKRNAPKILKIIS
jgi:nitroreductase